MIFSIWRFNPEKDTSPYFQDYKLKKIPQGTTLLDCMNLIKWTQDGTLTYRMSCRSAICGSCAIKVNGHAILACKTQVSNVIKDGKVKIEPLGNMEIIKDLVVDLGPFWERIEKIRPWLMPDESERYEKERYQSIDDFRKIDESSTCIMCGCCYSDCSSLDVDKVFLGPTALAKGQRFIDDSRDKERLNRIRELSDKGGIWDCTHCGECSERCPTEARPLERITSMRRTALALGIINNIGARHVKGFVDSIAHSGRLNENILPIRSMGIFNIPGLMSLIPIGIRMIMRRKNPSIIHRSIDEVEDIRRIVEELCKRLRKG
ncbi:MAG: succinate dehydrogenase iron-sulfur subunit [Nitrospinae bacterium]|nr:succinate dehydrogenase iron-sulfur subunit [Nitrospinota bacterium]